MSKDVQNSSEPAKMVFVVTCFGNVVGVYSVLEDAQQVQRDFIMKNRASELICKPLI